MSITIIHAEPLAEAKAIALAPQMHEGGWSVYAIRDYFERRGLKRSWRTVKRWAIPEFGHRDREETRQRMREICAERSGGRLAGHARHGAEFKVARARALRARGVSWAAIAAVMDLDFGEGLTADQWRYALAHGHMPMAYRRQRAAA